MSAFDGEGSNFDPKEFAQFVKKASTDELKRAVQGERRGQILDGIFGQMPSLFRADRAGDTSAVIHWIVGDRPDGGADTYELVITDGTCQLSAKPEHDPKLSLILGAVDFLKLVTGNANAVTMFMTGKLKAKGDLGLGSKIGNVFDIPKA
jgi:hypothetical protein